MMKNTNKTRRLPKNICPHMTTIELADGVKVCTCCEKVIR